MSPRPSSTYAARLRVVVLIAVVVAAVVTFVQWPVLSAHALAFDDGEFIVHNPAIQNPGLASTKRFLCEVLEPSTVHGYYIPLTMISLMLDYAAGGRPDDLRQFHRTNLALHVMTTVAVVVLLSVLFGRPWIAGLVGILYGIHPLVVEPIAWVGERKTVLATCFALWCMVVYVLHARRRRRSLALASIALYLLAVMSKPTTVPLPILLLILDYWPLNRLSRRALIEKIPLFVIGGASAVVTLISNARTANITLPVSAPVAPLLLRISHNLFFYVRKIVWPGTLTPFYPSPEPFALSQPIVLGSVVGVVVAAAAVAVSLRRTRCLLAGALFFLVALSPTLGIVGYSWINVSDKYAYLPVVGLLLPLAYALCSFWDGGTRAAGTLVRRGVIVLGAMVVAAAAAGGARSYLREWRDSESLYTHMLAVAPRAAVLHYSLGNTLSDQGRYEEAIEHYQYAVRARPDVADIHVGLGGALLRVGRADEALQQYTQALQIDPACAAAHNGMGIVFSTRGDMEQASVHHAEAVRINPRFLDARINLGGLNLQRGLVDDAIEQFKAALKIAPRSVEAHVNMGVALRRQGRLDEALRHYEAARKSEPCHPAILRNIASVLQEQGKTREAAVQRVNALFCEGLSLERRGRLEAASEQYRKVLELLPHHAEAARRLDNLSAARRGG
ncbi:MAG: tetratricopeptide repeat protein [Phycisphaerae bacterium]